VIDFDTETEAQAAERIRRAKARAALSAAPETAARLRAKGIPADGRTEADVLPEWRTPILTEVVDAADALFVALRDWAEIWAARLHLEAPTPGVWMRRDGTPLGFRAGTTEEQASLLVTTVAAWLLLHDEEIATAPGAAEFHEAVVAAVWSLRTKSAFRTAVVTWSDRACPACRSDEVRGEFFGEPMEAAEARGEDLLEEVKGVAVSCAFCGWTAEAHPSSIARWLAGDATKGNRNHPDRQSFDDEYWSIDQAARHFGYSAATIRRYIREGLPAYRNKHWVRPSEVADDVVRRLRKESDTQPRKR